MPGRTVEKVLADLTRIGSRLEEINVERDDLYRKRDDLIVEAREAFDSPVTIGRISEAAQMTEQALQAARKKIGVRRGRKVR